MKVTLQSIGCGDAFASLGNYHSAHLIKSDDLCILLDCGATILNSFHEYKISPDEIDVLLISHFHGDHIGGIPFLLLKNVYQLKRSKPLKIIGPVGLRQRLFELIEAMYKGNGEKMLSAPYLEIEELSIRDKKVLNESITVEFFNTAHGSCVESIAMIFELGSKRFLYSGDTELTDDLKDELSKVDHALVECSSVEKIKGHISQQEIVDLMKKISISQLFVCHMSEELSFFNQLITKVIQGKVYEF